jgi:predicted phosphoribosyltransferase
LLRDHDVEVDVVLEIPRGDLPVARPVADVLGVPLDVDEGYIERERESEARATREKLERYRGVAEPPDVVDKRVLVVDEASFPQVFDEEAMAYREN